MSSDTTVRAVQNRGVPIDFFNLLDDEGWMPLPVLQTASAYLWNDGGLLADAPVDMEATFKGGMEISSKVDRAFNLNGLRCAPGFTVPRHHHNMDELIIVFGGEFTLEYDDGPQHRDTISSRTVAPGEFWISEAGTAYMMTAGPRGVTYIETWPDPMSTLKTYWHDGGWIHR